MNIVALKETHPGERRAALVPAAAARLAALGADVAVEAGLGEGCHHADEAYRAAGVRVETGREALLRGADLVLGLRKPAVSDVALLKAGCVYISFLDPFNEPDLIRALASRGVSALSVEMIPRISRAQKMDALSSQASLTGYVAVILAAERIHQVFPMMVTPAGTIQPCRVLVIGAGVAGLQAIATAHRLGARVEAFDTRPEVEEQIASLGAKFVKIDLGGETGSAEGGYARALTPEQLEKQKQGLAARCAQSDVVITAAQVFGRKAPVIMSAAMVRGMKPGSVIVDTAVETGGNVEGVLLDKEAMIGGVRLIGLGNLPGRVCVHASQMYASNLVNLVEAFWNAETKTFDLQMEDDLIRGCLVTHQGQVVHPKLQPQAR